MTIQQNNKRNNVFVEIEGITKTASQWEKEFDLGVGTLLRRVKSGWAESDLLCAPSVLNRSKKLKSGVRGVSWYSTRGIWGVRYYKSIGAKPINIGEYKDINNAIYAQSYYAEFGIKLNEEEVKRQIKLGAKRFN